MNKKYLISVIIPVYNSESFLASRFDHLIKHDLENVQIIIVDDGSTDGSPKICRRYFAENEDARIITQENRGLSGARNRGVEEAEGEYVAFLDSDDILLYRGFAEAKAYLSVRKPDVLTGKYVVIMKNGREIRPGYGLPEAESAADARNQLYRTATDSVWSACRSICRREFLIENKLFFTPGIIWEDMEWSPRMLRAAGSIGFLDEPFYGYFHKRPGSITSTSKARRLRDVSAIVAESVEAYISEEYGAALARRLIRESFYSLSLYCLCSRSERAELRPGIEAAVGCYGRSPSAAIRVFLKTRKIVPLYIWSLSLLFAKTARGLLSGLLGPVTQR